MALFSAGSSLTYHRHHHDNLLWRHSTGAQQRRTNNTVYTLWGIKTHQNVFRHNFRKTRRILNKFGRLLLK